MIRLYDFELSGSCYKLRLLMNMLDIRYEKTNIDFVNKEHKGEAFLKINPLGEIPVLEDEGLRLPLKPQTEYAGHTERIEEITLPTDVIAAIEASGETGEEAGDLTTSSTVKPRTHLITPTLTADADSEGTVVPRALPVETP